jgi:hypothetical protein
MNRIDELMELAIAWARAECSVGEFRAAIEQELAEADGRGFTRGVKASRAAAQPQPEPVRTALEQYDLDQSPAYREGYEDGRRKGYEVGKRHAAQPQPEARVYPLPDDLYPGSKDWMASDYAGRVEWLHGMYESARREADMWCERAQPQPEAQVQRIAYLEQQLGECTGGYQTLEREVASLKQPEARELTDDELRNLWINRPSIHNGELVPQLYDFARAVLAAAKGKP